MKAKRNMLGLFIFLLGSVTAQTVEKYYDFKWIETVPENARFYSKIIPTDSGWLREDYYALQGTLQMRGLYADRGCAIPSGGFQYYYPDRVLQSAGRFRQGLKEGSWMGYHPDGVISDSAFYDHGKEVNVCMHWHENGFPKDSTIYDEKGRSVAVSWFSDGTLSSAGRFTADHLMHGKWVFYHSNGKLSAAETYDKGRLLERKYFTEEGAPMEDTTDRTRAAEFKGGIPAWQKYLQKNLYFPSVHFTNGNQAGVLIDFIIDEKGKVKNARIEAPSFPDFDDIALRIISNTPLWIPAIDYNRTVADKKRQPISFIQQ